MINNEFSSFSILVSSSTIASSMEDEESFNMRRDMKKSNRKNSLKHHQTSSPSSYTSSLSNSNINKLSLFTSKLKSKMLISKRKDKKCKRLINEFCSKKKRNNITDGASIEWSFALFDCNKLEKPIEKEDLGSLVATIYKIMDKSLGWLKLKSKSKLKKTKNSKLGNYNSQLTEENFNYDTADEEENELYNLAITNATCESTSNQIEESFSCIEKSSNNSNNQIFLVHSTPQPNQNKIYNHFSPIICSSSIISSQFSYSTNSSSFLSSHSTPIKSSDHYNSSAGPCRLSFGVTSSPKSLADHQNDINKEYLFKQNYFDNNIYYDSNYESKFNDNNFTNHNESYDMILQKKLIDRLNDIKQNVRMRNIQKITNLNSVSITNRSDYKMNIKTKSKKLQKIFQSKLQKQLKEIKKWQTKVVKNNTNELRCTSKSKKSIITSTFTSLTYLDQNNVICSCSNNNYNNNNRQIYINPTTNSNNINKKNSIYYEKLNYYQC
jgi:hypothetical protein